MIAHVAADRLDESSVAVRWAPPQDVRVSAGTGDDVIAIAEARGSEAVLRGVPALPRHWFRVRPSDGPELVVFERLVPVEGTLNFRDLGGYAGSDGRRVRWGLVYRSDGLAQIADWTAFSGLGIREIFDLRIDVERERAAYAPPPGVITTHLAIGGRGAEAPDLIELLRSGGEDDFGLDYVVRMYQTLLLEHVDVFGELLSHLAEPGRLPALFHCTAGKDRTGVAAALLLSVLGVEREVVLDDYELTNLYRSRRRIEFLRAQLEAAGVDVERVRPYLSAPRPALEAALTGVDLEHGDVERFLVSAGALSRETIARLREGLLEP